MMHKKTFLLGLVAGICDERHGRVERGEGRKLTL
mgnify:CR=1 FL=1